MADYKQKKIKSVTDFLIVVKLFLFLEFCELQNLTFFSRVYVAVSGGHPTVKEFKCRQ